MRWKGSGFGNISATFVCLLRGDVVSLIPIFSSTSMEFVSIEIAKKLKEKGFAEKCLAYYVEGDSIILNESMPESEGEVFNMENLLFSCNRECSESMFDAPTITQVLKWLREDKKVYIDVVSFSTYTTKNRVAFAVVVRHDSDGYSMKECEHAQSFSKWEDAALAGIEYALDNLVCNIYNGHAM